MEPWEELDELIQELRAANEEWARSADALQEQLGSFKDLTQKLDTQFAELGVYEAMLELSRRTLNDAGRLHQSRMHYGLTRAVALLWHAIEDPRPHLATAPPEGAYSVEVRIGPLYLLGARSGQGADERLSILIEGEKQLIAPLPTTPARFRVALLRAFAAPQYVGPPREQPDTPAEQPAGTDAPPAEPEPAEAAAQPAAEAPSGGNSAAAEQPSEPEEGAAPEAQAAEASGPRPRRGRRTKAAGTGEGDKPEAAPTGETPDVIELPGSGAGS
jgi:hypothetical protein